MKPFVKGKSKQIINYPKALALTPISPFSWLLIWKKENDLYKLKKKERERNLELTNCLLVMARLFVTLKK